MKRTIVAGIGLLTAAGIPSMDASAYAQMISSSIGSYGAGVGSSSSMSRYKTDPTYATGYNYPAASYGYSSPYRPSHAYTSPRTQYQASYRYPGSSYYPQSYNNTRSSYYGNYSYPTPSYGYVR